MFAGDEVMSKGTLIAIEAGDGCGKATQTRLLQERLLREGRKVQGITFPDYEAEGSALVRMYLRGDFGKKAEDVNAFAASAFYAVDRFASFRTKWQERYEAGDIILADRYTTSNMVHQSVKLGKGQERENFLDWLWDLEFRKLGLPIPNAVLFLDMDPAVSDQLIAARSGKREKDIHERDMEYLHKCHEAYLELSEKYGWIRIQCSEGEKPRGIEEIHEEIYRAVQEVLSR